jgi:hypothetical protein
MEILINHGITIEPTREPKWDPTFTTPMGYVRYTYLSSMASLNTKNLFQHLIWSGASLFPRTNVFDFKVSIYDDEPHLTFVLDDKKPTTDGRAGSTGIILDNRYQLRETIRANNGSDPVDMHEFSILNQDRHAIVMSHSKEYDSQLDVYLDTQFFREVDIETGDPFFEWHALDHIPLSASTVTKPNDTKSKWDWL